MLAARYYGLPCPACAPHVGKIIRAKGSSANGKKLGAYGKELVNANVGGGLWTARHNAVLLAISSELSFINNVHKTDAYSVSQRGECAACAVSREAAVAILKIYSAAAACSRASLVTGLRGGVQARGGLLRRGRQAQTGVRARHLPRASRGPRYPHRR